MRNKNGTLESLILNALWNFEKNHVYTNSVKDVYEALKLSADTERAYTTVKTVMDRLHQKEILLRFKQKNKFFYRTAFSKKDMLNSDIERLANLYFEGNVEHLSMAIAGIVNETKAKDDETLVETA